MINASKEEIKDALDTRDNELGKDVSEEVKEAAEVIENAAEATNEDIKDLVDGEE